MVTVLLSLQLNKERSNIQNMNICKYFYVVQGSRIITKYETWVQAKRRRKLTSVREQEFVWEFFSTLMFCTRVDESWQARDEMRICQFSCPGHTRTRVTSELIGIDKWEFVWEFSQLSCPGQTRTRVVWKLTGESLYESFLNSHILVKREQELHERWWELISESLFHSLPTLMSWSHKNKGSMRVEEELANGI